LAKVRGVDECVNQNPRRLHPVIQRKRGSSPEDARDTAAVLYSSLRDGSPLSRGWRLGL